MTKTNKNSIYVKCFNCGMWGINLPDNKQCGNCNSYNTTFYYSEEDLEFAIIRKYGINEEDKPSKPPYIPSPIRMTNIENGIVEPEISKENPPVISELSEEVKQAIEKNKKENKAFLENVVIIELYLMSLDNKKAVEIGEGLLKTIKIKIQQSQDLVDALDKQFGGKE